MNYEKTILQNMYNFNEPKVALVLRKDSKGCYDFVELNGYIVEMVYNEHGAFIKSRTFFIDKSETVNPGVEKVIEYIPRTLTVDQVVDILERLRQVAEDDVKELNYLRGYRINSPKVCELLKTGFDINFEFSEDLYCKNTVLKYDLNVVTYREDKDYCLASIETKDFDHLVSEVEFLDSNSFYPYSEKEDYSRRYDYFCRDLVEKLKSEINMRKEIFGFLHDYDITCTSVDLLGDERDEELMKLINEKLKNKKGV